MTDKGNFLAGGDAKPAPAAAPYKAPVSDGSNKGPIIGDRKPIQRPEVHTIASTAGPARASNDVRSGMDAAMGVMADKMHPTKRR